MNSEFAAQDVVVYFVLLAVVFMYRIQLRRHVEHGLKRRLVVMWTRCGVAFATYFMIVGVCHQSGMLPGIVTYALFGIGIVVLFICLRTLRVKMRDASIEHVSNTEGK